MCLCLYLCFVVRSVREEGETRKTSQRRTRKRVEYSKSNKKAADKQPHGDF